MASFMYNQALTDILTGAIDLDTDVLKIMLVGSANTVYVPNPDHTVVDNAANDATDPSFCEVSATNYVGAFAGAGRKVATATIEKQDASDRAVVKITDLTWTAIGGVSNDTITGAILIKENTADTDSRLIAFFDIANTTSNGSDFTLDFDEVNGNIQFNINQT